MPNWIGGYEQLTEMKTVGSGSARWCIAQRYGQRFFVKEFLSPVYPQGEERAVWAEARRERCERFAQQKQRLYAAASCVIGDTLVPVVDFFCQDGRYYAISKEVPQPYISGESIGRLPFPVAQEALHSLAQCLQRLHTQGIVHADLKPEHLFFIPHGAGYSLRLIDLDSGFLESDPPQEAGTIEGDPVYIAPEAFLCLAGEAVPLTHKVDTFALGILFHQLWTGVLPSFNADKCTYFYEAALMGEDIRLSPGFPEIYRAFLRRMLHRDPAQRPSDSEVVRLFASALRQQSFSIRDRKNQMPLNGLSRFMKK